MVVKITYLFPRSSCLLMVGVVFCCTAGRTKENEVSERAMLQMNRVAHVRVVLRMTGALQSQTQMGVVKRTPDEFVCGAVSSLVNISVTFPLNKIMFRQQLQGIRMWRAFRQVQREGLIFLYRGLLPPLVQRTATVSLMFGTYAQYFQAVHRRIPTMPWLVTHVVAAVGAGCTEAILAPFERVQVVLQMRDYHGDVHNSLHAFRTITEYGYRELYRGLSAILWRNGPSNALFLGLRDPLQRILPLSEDRFGQTLSAFVSGAGLGAALSTVFFPLNVVKARMQSRIGGPYLSIRQALQETLAERGYRWRKLFRGVHINYTRSFVSWGIINAVYDYLMRQFRTLRSAD